MKKDLNNGRKCDYPYQCKSRTCDSDTNSCTGLSRGDSCESHVECTAGLACRPSSIWPYSTMCLPLAEVGSACETDYDCQPRNFCWKLTKTSSSHCYQKHSAPDFTTFVWDDVKYPGPLSKESVFYHGRYCYSGVAKKNDAGMAECVTLDE
jgi:hypothetical protein